MSRRVAKSLREMAEELLRKADELDAADGVQPALEERPRAKATPRGRENLDRAYRRNGVYPPGAWKK